MILRPCQQEAVDEVYEHLRTKDTTPCVVLPTGTGKSLVPGEDRLRRGDTLGRSRPHPRPCQGVAGAERRQGAETLPRTEGRRLFRRIELARHAGVRHRGGHPKRVQQGLRPRHVPRRATCRRWCPARDMPRPTFRPSTRGRANSSRTNWPPRWTARSWSGRPARKSPS